MLYQSVVAPVKKFQNLEAQIKYEMEVFEKSEQKGIS